MSGGAAEGGGRGGEGGAGGARPHDDPQVKVRVFLIGRGCPGNVVAGGLDGLISEWEKTGAAIAAGYPPDTLEDYLDDMDARNLIHDAVAAVPAALDAARRARLDAADRAVRAHLVPTPVCLWGAEQAEREGWKASERWWYFKRPARPGPGLSEDLGL